jgi:ribA/ribD-fused uncharacterized protein
LTLTDSNKRYTTGKEYICAFCGDHFPSLKLKQLHTKAFHNIEKGYVPCSPTRKTKLNDSGGTSHNSTVSVEDVVDAPVTKLLDDLVNLVVSSVSAKKESLELQEEFVSSSNKLPPLKVDDFSSTVVDRIPYMSILLATWQLVVLDVPKDGFCILQAVIQCLGFQRKGKIKINALKSQLRQYILDNTSQYNVYGESTVPELLEYLDKGTFFQQSVDLIPEILVNCLEVNINIITQLPKDFCTITRLQPASSISNKPLLTLTLVRCDAYSEKNLGTHYCSAIPSAKMSNKLKKVSISRGDWLIRCPKTSTTYHLFRSPSMLSNFYQTEFSVNNENYTCSEQFIQANRYPKDHNMYKAIMKESNPRVMKGMGDRAGKNRARDIANVVTAIWAKFSADPKLKSVLLSTGNHILVEATHSKVWAIGRDITKDSEDSILNYANWCGQQGIGILGVLLMIVRADLLNKKESPSWNLIEGYFGPLDYMSTTPKRLSVPLVSYHEVTDNSSSPFSMSCDSAGGDNTMDQQNWQDNVNRSHNEFTTPPSPPTSCEHINENTYPPPSYASVVSDSPRIPELRYRTPFQAKQNSGSVPHVDRRVLSNLSVPTDRQPSRVQPLTLAMPKVAHYFPPQGWSATETVHILNKARPDIGKFISPRGNRLVCSNPEVQGRLKFGVVVSDPQLATPLTRKTPPSSYITKWVTNPLPDEPYIREALAAHPRVLYISPNKRVNNKMSWKITTAYTRATPIPIKSEANYLELKGGVVIKLSVLGQLHCKVCKGSGHLARVCDQVRHVKVSNELGAGFEQELCRSDSTKLGPIQNLMEITFSNKDLSRLFPNNELPRLEQKLLRENLNERQVPRQYYYYNTEYGKDITQQKLYTINLTLDKLIKFWAIFPEWIPSLASCPLNNPERFLVFPNSNGWYR